MAEIESVVEATIGRSSVSYALIDATNYNQEILGNKQVTDSQAGIIANDLLTTQYDASTEVLNQDTANAQAEAGDANDFNTQNQIYQNDSAATQTGQNNASTAVQTIETQVSQDATNLATLASLATTIISIGSYTAGLINAAYT